MFIYGNNLLLQYKGRKFIGTSELASTATAILSQLGAPQERGTVKEDVDERTVRYYQSEGLIETPTEKKGTASVYNYKHLLALVAIKQLQSQDLPIKKIKRIIQGMSEGDLESILERTPVLKPEPDVAKDEAREYLEGISRTMEWEPMSSRMSKPSYSRSSRMRSSAPSPQSDEEEAPIEPLMSMNRESMSLRRQLAPRGSDPESPRILYSLAQTPIEPVEENWKRFELIPGVELMVREDVLRHADERTRLSLIEKLEQVIRFLTDR